MIEINDFTFWNLYLGSIWWDLVGFCNRLILIKTVKFICSYRNTVIFDRKCSSDLKWAFFQSKIRIKLVFGWRGVFWGFVPTRFNPSFSWFWLFLYFWFIFEFYLDPPWYQLGLLPSEIGRLCAQLLKRVFPWLKSYASYRIR